MSHSRKHINKRKTLNDSRVWDSEIEIISEVLPTTKSEETRNKDRFLSKNKSRFKISGESSTDNDQHSEPEILYEKPKDHKLKKQKIYDDAIATIRSSNVRSSIHALSDGDSDKESRIDDHSMQQAGNSILSPRKSKKVKSKKHRKNSGHESDIVCENLISSKENDTLKASVDDENVEKKKKKSKRHHDKLINVLDNDSILGNIANEGKNLVSDGENGTSKASVNDNVEKEEMFSKGSPKKKKKSKRHHEEFINVLDNDSIPGNIGNGGENLISGVENDTSKASGYDINENVEKKNKKSKRRHKEVSNVLDNDSIPEVLPSTTIEETGNKNRFISKKKHRSFESSSKLNTDIDQLSEPEILYEKPKDHKLKKQKVYDDAIASIRSLNIRRSIHALSDDDNDKECTIDDPCMQQVETSILSPHKSKKGKSKKHRKNSGLESDVVCENFISSKENDTLKASLDDEIVEKKKKKSERHHDKLINVLDNDSILGNIANGSGKNCTSTASVNDNVEKEEKVSKGSPKKKKKSKRHHEEFINVLDNDSIHGNIANGDENLLSGVENDNVNASVNDNVEKEEMFSEVSPKKKKKSKKHHKDSEVSPKKSKMKKSKRRRKELSPVIDNDTVWVNGGENDMSKATACDVNENMEKEEENISIVSPKKKKKSKRNRKELTNVIDDNSLSGNLANGEENDTYRSVYDVNENLEIEERFSIVSPQKTKRKKLKRRDKELTTVINNDTVRGNLTNGDENYEDLDPVYDLIENLEKGVKNTSKNGISPVRKRTVIKQIYDLSDIEENIDDPDTELSKNSRLSRHKSKKNKRKKQKIDESDQGAAYDLDENEDSSSIKSVHSVIADDNPKSEALILKTKKFRRHKKTSASGNNKVSNHKNDADIVEEEASSQSESDEGIDLNEEYEIPFLHQITNCHQQLKLSEVKELRAKGIPVKTGQFSEIENNILRKNLRRFRKLHNLDRQTISNFLGINGKSISKELRRYYRKQAADLQFVSELGRGLSHRTIFSIYRRARVLACEKEFGTPMTKEQDAELLHLVNLYGRNFSKISTIMKLPASKLLDRLRSERYNSEKSGHWSKRENKLLMKAVAKVMKVKYEEVFNYHTNINWHDVAALVPQRTAIQCRSHWLTQVRWKAKFGGHIITKFKISDTKKFVDLIRKSGVQDEEEIDWGSIFNEFPGRISYYHIRQLWKHLKSLHPNSLLYVELLDYLNFLDEYLAKLPEESYIDYKLHQD